MDEAQIQRHLYYMEHRESLKRKALERYHQKKTDPEFYKKFLIKNKEYKQKMEELDKKKRHEYYLKRKDIINQKARDRYKEKRLDPEFYRTMLEKNQISYHRKVNNIDSTPWTQEMEDEFFKKITRDVKAVNEMDKDKRPALIDYNSYHSLFVEDD